MRFSEAIGRQVVSTATAATVGKIDELLIDPHAQTVIAMTLKKTERAAEGHTLRWSDITAFGVDAVIVSGLDKLTETPPDLAELSNRHHRVIGKRVLATTGDELGTVDDLEFDPDTGAITALVLADSQPPDGQIPGARLVGVGSYAVVVQAGPEQQEPRSAAPPGAARRHHDR